MDEHTLETYYIRYLREIREVKESTVKHGIFMLCRE